MLSIHAVRQSVDMATENSDRFLAEELGFKNDSGLAKRLMEVLKKNDESERFLVGITDCFGEMDAPSILITI